MNVFLMHKDHDFDPRREPVWNTATIIRDLELDILLNVMAGRNNETRSLIRTVLLNSSTDPEEIIFRRDIQQDCINNAAAVRDIHILAGKALETKDNTFWGVPTGSPSYLLNTSIILLRALMDKLVDLRSISDECAEDFTSEGFTAFFAMVRREFSDASMAAIMEHIEELSTNRETRFSAGLGKGNKGTDYLLHKTGDKKRGLTERIFTRNTPGHTFTISANDGAAAELKSHAVNVSANIIARAVDHLYEFFDTLRTELTFYLSSLTLYETLEKLGQPVCSPEPAPPGERKFSCKGLFDVCLALTTGENVIGNDISADNRDLMIITGPNQGGKSTFLRSIGLAQLMMQCGMFVPAESYTADISQGTFTHFRRGEDTTMESGKLDEELRRMSDIVDHLKADSLVLFDESFMATNEREGSEIARQVTGALLEKGIKVCFVTHQYEFAHSYVYNKTINTIFLRAERKDDGTRTFRIIEGEPLETGYGEDLYNMVFSNRLKEE